jgi:hypothetical protein
MAPGADILLEGFLNTECCHCGGMVIFVSGELYYPKASSAPRAPEDLPDDILDVYEEARQVFDVSPRCAAGLLRVLIEMLCDRLGFQGKDLNEKIGRLQAAGVNDNGRKALDVVRVVGNAGVHHHGLINLNESREVAWRLFMVVAYVVNRFITDERMVEAMYEDLPPGKLQGIEDRRKRLDAQKEDPSGSSV